jgi:cysteine-rich repeat protein
MKFHQGLAGLLTLLTPFATVCYTPVTEWGTDLTPYHPVLPGKIDGDGTRRDREMAQNQRLPMDRRKLLTEADFCDGTPITRKVPCGGVDIIDLALVQGTTYTIDVQRVDCLSLDPRSFLYPPGENPSLSNSDYVAKEDDAGPGNLPAFCDQTSEVFYSDPYLQYEVDETGTFTLLTHSQTWSPTPACPFPINDLEFEYRVFISCSNCGNGGDPEGPEECDDGNYENNDLCSATCRRPFCGDGVVNYDDGCDSRGFNAVCQNSEECDDGNNVSGDGCSATCQPETGGAAAAQGDPHFKTWRGQNFDFHGECDLVLLHTPAFESGLGLDVHIRTKLRRDMSYISSAALRIGSHVLEVESQGVYYLNGVAGAALPAEFSGFAFSHTQPSEKQHVFEVHLAGHERIQIKTYKDFVSVFIEQGESKHFGDSAGLMGDFEKGRMIGRDGKTVLDDANVFGQEWQVLHTEPSLFQTVRFPQHPNLCTMPPPMQASQLRRRLLESSSVDELAAEKACAHWGEGNKDACVYDVLTTGDLEMAVVGAY